MNPYKDENPERETDRLKRALAYWAEWDGDKNTAELAVENIRKRLANIEKGLTAGY